MTKRFVLIIVAAALFAAQAAATGKVVTIGTPYAGNRIPWDGESTNQHRFQCLWLKSAINYAGYVNKVEFRKTNNNSGRFSNVRVWLCHTSLSQLNANFNSNYDDNQPHQVLNDPSLTLTGNGWFDIGITPFAFNYNNSDNLLLELKWNGDNNGVCQTYRTATTPPRRLYAWNETATNGSLLNETQHIRLTIGTYTGVAPTSLGRVKALFE
jgi:hypothetical protein